jgi:hypothetical protein
LLQPEQPELQPQPLGLQQALLQQPDDSRLLPKFASVLRPPIIPLAMVLRPPQMLNPVLHEQEQQFEGQQLFTGTSHMVHFPPSRKAAKNALQ